MKKYLLIIIFTIFATAAFSQQSGNNKPNINNLRLETRVDFDCFSQNDSLYSGFSGQYLNFIISGDFTKDFFYAYRQRLNNVQNISSFFDATDYLYFGWRITKNLSWTVGKEIVAIGGSEYDLAPIDVYFHTEFWNNINCFRFGTNLIYTTKNKKNTFTLQFTNSPYDNSVLYGSLYNYSLQWRGEFEHFGPICSVNMFEYQKGKFQNVIALGTTFRFGHVCGYLDLMNRASFEQDDFFLKDMTVVGRIGYNFMHDQMQVFFKTGHDVNDAQYSNTPYDEAYDLCILPGTDIMFYGGGFEYYPMKNSKDLRIHAFFAVHDATKNKVGNSDITYQANAGVTWKLNFIKR